MKDNNNPQFTETGAKDHDPQSRAEQIKSTDNVRTANQYDQSRNQDDHTPNHPHPGKGPEGKKSGGSGM